MKTLFTLTIITFLMISCGSESSAPEAITADFSLEGFEVLEYPGTKAFQAIKKGADDKVVEEGTIINGKKNGTWYTYHQRTGAIKTASDYIDGQLNGIHLELDDRGQVVLKAYYVNNMLDGPFKRFRFGKVNEDATYVANQLEGTYKKYHKNGKLEQESQFKNGKRNGPAVYYNDQEEKIMEYVYEDGEIVSGGGVTPTPAESGN